MASDRSSQVLALLDTDRGLTSSAIAEQMNRSEEISLPTVKRDLARLVTEGLVKVEGKGRATRYTLGPAGLLLRPVDVAHYFEHEIDERDVRTSFNWGVFDALKKVTLFTTPERERLSGLRESFENRVAGLSPVTLRKEQERLAIDLSWKSSQIEGNTYSLLETERLLKDRQTADGKTQEEATMLLNHKAAIDLLLEYPDYLDPLRISGITDIHRLLVDGLAVDLGIRAHRVGISGTNYVPLDNSFQLEEALQATCELINATPGAYDKALLALVLISYIQPFQDGNKRTARIVSNALLLAQGCCPLSFRTVDPIYYKEAMLIFYEQNSLAPFKQVFIEQAEFAVNTYF